MVSSQPSQFDRSERGGRYVRQTTGYRAFIPAPLPPDPPIEIDAEMQHWLSAQTVPCESCIGQSKLSQMPSICNDV